MQERGFKSAFPPREGSTGHNSMGYTVLDGPFGLFERAVKQMRVLKQAIVYTIALGCAAGTAHSVEFCVVCDGPAARYACTFNDPAAVAGDARLKLLCITELAKSGPHASCAVERAQTARCEGAISKVLAMPDGMQHSEPSAAQAPLPANAAKATGSPSGNSVSPPNPSPEAAGQPAAPKPDGPPKTVQEMVEQGNASTSKALAKTGETAVEAAKSTGSAIEKAGKAVGNAAKKTWNCITTLFGDC